MISRVKVRCAGWDASLRPRSQAGAKPGASKTRLLLLMFSDLIFSSPVLTVAQLRISSLGILGVLMFWMLIWAASCSTTPRR